MVRISLAVLGLVATAACGRFGFDGNGSDPDAAGSADASLDAPADARPDATVCTTAVHDEDGDSVDDACDVCPHLPDLDQADRDGDRVGDLCDPEPDIARQSIAMFDPLTSLTSGWEINSDASLAGDELVIAGPNSSGAYQRPYTVGLDTFVIGGVTGAAVQTQQHLVAILASNDAGPGAYYCELYDGGVDSDLFFTVTEDGTNYSHPAGSPLPRFANSAGRIRYEIDSADVTCGTTWGVTPERVISAARPTTIAVDQFRIYAENVELRVHYVLQIRTSP